MVDISLTNMSLRIAFRDLLALFVSFCSWVNMCLSLVLFWINLALYHVSHSVFIYLSHLTRNRRHRDSFNMALSSLSLGFFLHCILKAIYDDIVRFRCKKFYCSYQYPYSIIFKANFMDICNKIYYKDNCLEIVVGLIKIALYGTSSVDPSFSNIWASITSKSITII